MIYQSSDKKFALQLDSEIFKVLLGHVANAGNKETGGILIGYYSENKNLAIVTCISGPPRDSQSGHTWFKRGVKGLQKLLNEAWKKKQYYLGEWHFHPNNSADPSFCDKNQMTEISRSNQYHCPEPVLLIIGGDPDNYEVKVFVTLPNKKLIELNNQASNLLL